MKEEKSFNHPGLLRRLRFLLFGWLGHFLYDFRLRSGEGAFGRGHANGFLEAVNALRHGLDQAGLFAGRVQPNMNVLRLEAEFCGEVLHGNTRFSRFPQSGQDQFLDRATLAQFGFWRFASDGLPASGGGWTSLIGGHDLLFDYCNFSSQHLTLFHQGNQRTESGERNVKAHGIRECS